MLAAVIWTPDEACNLPAAFPRQLVGCQDDVLFTFILSLACCSVISHEKLVRVLSSLFAITIKLTMHTATGSRVVNSSGFYCYCPAHAVWIL